MKKVTIIARIVICVLAVIITANLGYCAYILMYTPRCNTAKSTGTNQFVYPLEDVDNDGGYTLKRTVGFITYSISDSELLYKAKNYIVVYHRTTDVYNPYNTIAVYKDGEVISYVECNSPGAMFGWAEHSTTCVWPLYVVYHWKIFAGVLILGLSLYAVIRYRSKNAL